MRVAVDAMGGDYAPREVVLGALQAARLGGIEILLVGDPPALKTGLAAAEVGEGLPLRLVPAEGVIGEGEPPVQALRQKPRASIAVAAGLVKQGAADAFVTMGSTGAAVAAATMALGLLEGIGRPALGGPVLGLAPDTVLVDLGSQVDCRPEHLLSFAVLGMAFARTVLGVQEPRVALLTVGTEEGKGTRLVKEAADLLRARGLPFAGFVEGHQLPFLRAAQVVVCDGFVGNIVMKLLEGVGSALAEHARRRLAGLLSPAEAERYDQEVYDLLNVVERAGGGPLFGVNGVAIVGHGRSRAPAVANAILTARRAVEVGLVQAMREDLARLRRAQPAGG